MPCQVMVSGTPRRCTGAPWGLAQRRVAGDEPGRCAHREAVVQLPPERLHWARYAGKNFTDRQRIKRKAQSWGRRYAALPAAERLAVLGR